jgi:hypothetical protein
MRLRKNANQTSVNFLVFLDALSQREFDNVYFSTQLDGLPSGCFITIQVVIKER